MKRIIFILKCILLWTTAFTIILFITGIDSLYINNVLSSLVICALLCSLCYRFISKDELEKLTFYREFNNLLEK